MRNNLLKDTFRLLIDTKIIKSIFPSFLLLIGTSSLFAIDIKSFSLIVPICGLLLFPILMTLLRSRDNDQSFVIPSITIILKKSWKIFVAELITFLTIFLGFICFVVPGIILIKRYVYVGMICEEQMTGPLDSMRKSAELSTNNGWRVFLYGIVIAFLFMYLSLPLSLIPEILKVNTVLEFICNLPYLYLIYIGMNLFIFTAYKQALNMNNSPILK